MMDGKPDWLTPTLMEVPFYRDGMTQEEYEKEREYYGKNYHLIISGEMKYRPLWKQKVKNMD